MKNPVNPSALDNGSIVNTRIKGLFTTFYFKFYTVYVEYVQRETPHK
jgi:hypothetical protein